jgi:hypothetical protein
MPSAYKISVRVTYAQKAAVMSTTARRDRAKEGASSEIDEVRVPREAKGASLLPIGLVCCSDQPLAPSTELIEVSRLLIAFGEHGDEVVDNRDERVGL